jgi:hypothetical protein
MTSLSGRVRSWSGLSWASQDSSARRNIPKAEDSPEFPCPGTVLALAAQQFKSAPSPGSAAFAASLALRAAGQRNKKDWLEVGARVMADSSCNARTLSAIANLQLTVG